MKQDRVSMTVLLFGLLVASMGQAGEGDALDKAQAERVRNYELQMKTDQVEHPTLAIGSPAPPFSLLGTDGKVHSLDDYKASPVLVVVFISNHCPASQLYEGRIKAIVRDYADKGVQVVAIAPNGPAAIGPSALNFTDVDDSFESMKIRADYRKFTFPYLYDGETQSVSHLYGPKVTPHVFVFDKERKLRFEGRFDDRLQESRAKTHEVRDAIDALLAGQPVAVPHTAVFGCSTKWNSHNESAKKEVLEWQATPVTVEPVSVEQLTQLRRNPGGKTLMVNFWATWCAPCQTEYPALLETYLWYRSREFEFVSVSVNAPEERAAVQKFLEKTHSGIRNLQVDTDDVFKVMSSFDPVWESGVPFTMVIAPDGKVIFQHSGEVDVLKLRRTILATLPDAGAFAGNTEYWRE
jgi:thiol-disulfide isomerase/thioredoxin